MIRCVEINLEPCFDTVFAALAQQVDVQQLNQILVLLSNHASLLTDAEFQTLLTISVNQPTVLSPLLSIKRYFNNLPSPQSRQAFTALLTAVPSDQTLVSLHTLYQRTPPMSQLQLTDYLTGSLEHLSAFTDCLKIVDDERLAAVITILHGSCWTRDEEKATSIADQSRLITQLSDATIHKLATQLYAHRPCPRFSALAVAASKPDFDVDKYIQGYELDPFGTREQEKSKWDLRGIPSFVAEMKELNTGNPITAEVQAVLNNDCGYMIAIASDYCLSIDNGPA
jgi:hypothetical protein